MDTARTLTAAVVKDGEWYVARCLEVEVASQGETVDEALVNLREALELFFEDDEVPRSFVHPLVTPIEIRIPARAQLCPKSLDAMSCERWKGRASSTPRPKAVT